MRSKPRIEVRSLLVCLWIVMTVIPSVAEDGGRASGQFTSKETTLKVTDAYAFYGTPSLGGREKVIVVVVSNQGFVKSEVDRYWDRRTALGRYFRDERTGLVYFEFGRDGRYRGLSYYFGPGDGCGYCADPAVTSAVRLQGNKLTGGLRFPEGGDPSRWFDISIDVTVSTDDHGRPQGAGGGEPGKAYLAYHRAPWGRDPKALRALLSAERRSAWEKAEASGKGTAFLSFLRDEHPKDVHVTQAYVSGDRALLLLEGKGPDGKVRGEAQFSLQQGSWRFDEETFGIDLK